MIAIYVYERLILLEINSGATNSPDSDGVKTFLQITHSVVAASKVFVIYFVVFMMSIHFKLSDAGTGVDQNMMENADCVVVDWFVADHVIFDPATRLW